MSSGPLECHNVNRVNYIGWTNIHSLGVFFPQRRQWEIVHSRKIVSFGYVIDCRRITLGARSRQLDCNRAAYAFIQGFIRIIFSCWCGHIGGTATRSTKPVAASITDKNFFSLGNILCCHCDKMWSFQNKICCILSFFRYLDVCIDSLLISSANYCCIIC